MSDDAGVGTSSVSVARRPCPLSASVAPLPASDAPCSVESVGAGVGAVVATTGSAQHSSEISISNLAEAAVPRRQRLRHVRACIVLLRPRMLSAQRAKTGSVGAVFSDFLVHSARFVEMHFASR